jgi:adenosylcobinamide-GDP ribazoletransferase
MRQVSMNANDANETVREKLGELAVAFGLLTRLPVPRLLLPAAGARSDAVWAYPLVGATVGALGGAIYWLAHALSLPPAFAALCALAAMIIATGAMHEDGIADFADGLAGRTREQRLAIMRDHQIGTYGVVALMLTLAMRATAVALIAEPGTLMAALIAAGAASRLSAVLLMAALRPARTDGLSVSVGRPDARLAAIALGLTFAICWLLLPFGAALLVVLSAGFGAAAIGRVALTRLGGQTGDVLGASSQLCECLALTVLLIA